ncbi:MAG: hypothetical protein OEZ06_03715 [Myxococcales bacterium]|nr:hypothetical protein [Myxococcales bacterium]
MTTPCHLRAALALMLLLTAGQTVGCEDGSPGDMGTGGSAGVAPQDAIDSPDEPEDLVSGPSGATETNVLGVKCESHSECPESFCNVLVDGPMPLGNCAAPGADPRGLPCSSREDCPADLVCDGADGSAQVKGACTDVDGLDAGA